MEFETLLDTNDPKIKRIVDVYKRILEAYQAINLPPQQDWSKSLSYGLTTSVTVNMAYSSSTDRIRV